MLKSFNSEFNPLIIVKSTFKREFTVALPTAEEARPSSGDPKAPLPKLFSVAIWVYPPEEFRQRAIFTQYVRCLTAILLRSFKPKPLYVEAIASYSQYT